MAEEGGGGGEFNDILFLLFVFLVLLFAWFTTGAYKKADLSGIFLAPPAPLGSGEAYGPSTIGQSGITFGIIGSPSSGTISDELQREIGNLNPADVSPYRGLVSFERTYGAASTNPQTEYLTIRANTANSNPISITGWRVASGISNRSAEIGKGVSVFAPNQIDIEGPVTMRPGDDAILITGRSPVGTSFRDNLCTGYLTQFQTIEPGPSFTCPMPESEANAAYPGFGLDNACYSFLQTISQCRITLDFPENLGSTCRQFIENRLTYQGCVQAHRNEPGFLSSTWRIYLGQSSELWKDQREVVKLLDQNGKLIDAVSF